jgi:hypothetical protein
MLSNPPSDHAISKVVDWGQLTPYISVRFFEEGGPERAWTTERFSRAAELTEILPSLLQQKSRKAGVRIGGAPQEIHTIGASFFDVASGDLQSCIDFDPAADLAKLLPRLSDQHIFLAALRYQVFGPPPWLQRGRSLGSDTLRDVRNHLVLLAALPPLIAITATQQPMHTMMSAFLEDGQIESLRLSAPVQPVPAQLLETAFVSGEAYHLWLSGLHRSVVTKPDKKTLTGRDLRHALDPYAEQTYTYSAVISQLAMGKTVKAPRPSAGDAKSIQRVGFSRSTKTVWLSKAPGVMEFAASLAMFRELLQKVDPRLHQETPAKAKERREARLGLNYLSSPIVAAELARAEEPFEVYLNAGEPDAEGDAPDSELSEIRDEWRARGFVELALDDPVKDRSVLPVKAYFGGKLIARLWLKISPAEQETVKVAVVKIQAADVHDPEMRWNYERFNQLLDTSRGNPFTIRYETGHVLEGEQLYKPEYHDVLFRDWRPISLAGVAGGRRFDPMKEKPDSWAKSSRSRKAMRDISGGDSLFARVACETALLMETKTDREWHLLCHDQANEVADFVYIEPENRRIALIHVKGAHSGESNRRVSIDAYQVVLAQAVKNLRHLERDVLYRKLASPAARPGKDQPRVGVFQISSREPDKISPDTGDFLAALQRMTKGLPAIHKKVIVFQPHIRSSYWETIVQRFERSASPREERTLWPAFMLSSLLIETEIACRKLGVGFEVWCDAS